MKTLALLLLATPLLAQPEEMHLDGSPQIMLADSGMGKTQPAIPAYKCNDRPKLKYKKPLSPYFRRRNPALGFSYKFGPEWPVLCKNTPKGSVPGKYNKKGGAKYSFGGRTFQCQEFSHMYGELVHIRSRLPHSCVPQGYQTNDKRPYYHAVFMTKHGMIPGKASTNLSEGWYPFQNKEFSIKDKDFYIIC